MEVGGTGEKAFEFVWRLKSVYKAHVGAGVSRCKRCQVDRVVLETDLQDGQLQLSRL